MDRSHNMILNININNTNKKKNTNNLCAYIIIFRSNYRLIIIL